MAKKILCKPILRSLATTTHGVLCLCTFKDINIQTGNVGGIDHNAYRNKLESNSTRVVECGLEELILVGFAGEQRDVLRNLSLTWVGSQTNWLLVIGSSLKFTC